MKKRKLILIFLPFVVAEAFGADGTPVLTIEASPLIRLVPGGLPPMTGYQHEFPSFARQKAVQTVAAYLGPEFNKSMVQRELNRRFSSAMGQCWSELERLGQNGCLFRVKLRVRRADAGSFYTLKDDGVTSLGAGPTADSICLAQRCGTEFASETLPVESLTDSSGYYWIERGKGESVSMRFYKLSKMEESVRFATFNTELLRHSQIAARQMALDGYAKRLAARTQKGKDEAAVQKLLDERDESRAKLAEVEKNLTEELDRAKTAADAAQTISSFASVFSLASSIAAASAITGENVSALGGGQISSKEGLLKVLGALGESAGKKIEALRVDEVKYRDGATNTETLLIGIGVKYQMDPKANPVISPRLP